METNSVSKVIFELYFDYLCVSDVTADFFNIQISKEVKEKNRFVAKSYQKSQKNRAQVINKTLSDFEYNMKGRKRHFYARSSDLAHRLQFFSI